MALTWIERSQNRPLDIYLALHRPATYPPTRHIPVKEMVPVSRILESISAVSNRWARVHVALDVTNIPGGLYAYFDNSLSPPALLPQDFPMLHTLYIDTTPHNSERTIRPEF